MKHDEIEATLDWLNVQQSGLEGIMLSAANGGEGRMHPDMKHIETIRAALTAQTCEENIENLTEATERAKKINKALQIFSWVENLIKSIERGEKIQWDDYQISEIRGGLPTIHAALTAQTEKDRVIGVMKEALEVLKSYRDEWSCDHGYTEQETGAWILKEEEEIYLEALDDCIEKINQALNPSAKLEGE